VIKKEESIKISRDFDYIHAPKHSNSLREFLAYYPDGAPDSVICKALCITQQELEDLYNSAITKLKQGMVPNGR